MEKDHLEILLEDISGKFDLVLEGHEALNRKFDAKFNELNEKIEHNSFLIGALNQKIDDVDNRLNDKIDHAEQRLNDKIDDVERRLNDKIDDVEKRLSGKIDAVATDLSAHRADTEAHHGVWRVKEGEE
ncbi:hypothetical protein [Geobacter sp.]|uniref:hypothetical protein n=1 Tax=Geobacter sp. TaxID=46610 RepID=UPI0026204C11|nr:hypothetical protein [Geobacter sp.]